MKYNTEGKKAIEAVDAVNKMIEASIKEYHFKTEKVTVTKMIHALYQYISKDIAKSNESVTDLLRALEKYEWDLKNKGPSVLKDAVGDGLDKKFAKFNETEGYIFIVNYPQADYYSTETIDNFEFSATVDMNKLEVDIGHTIETPPVYTPAQNYWRSVIKD